MLSRSAPVPYGYAEGACRLVRVPAGIVTAVGHCRGTLSGAPLHLTYALLGTSKRLENS
jgi:hypothetical protein